MSKIGNKLIKRRKQGDTLRIHSNQPIQKLSFIGEIDKQSNPNIKTTKSSGPKPILSDTANPYVSALRVDLLLKKPDDFNTLRQRISDVLRNSAKSGRPGEAIQQGLSDIAESYFTEGMSQTDREGIVRTIGSIAKMENNILATHRTISDPEVMDKALKFQQIIPQITQPFLYNQQQIDEWTVSFAIKHKLNPKHTKTPNLGWGLI